MSAPGQSVAAARARQDLRDCGRMTLLGTVPICGHSPVFRIVVADLRGGSGSCEISAVVGVAEDGGGLSVDGRSSAEEGGSCGGGFVGSYVLWRQRPRSPTSSAAATLGSVVV